MSVCVIASVCGVPTGERRLHIKANGPPRQAFNLTATTINVSGRTNVVDTEW